MQLHDALARAMKLGGFESQEDLAAAIREDGLGETGQGLVSMWLRGRKRPSDLSISRIAGACGVWIGTAGPGVWRVTRRKLTRPRT